MKATSAHELVSTHLCEIPGCTEEAKRGKRAAADRRSGRRALCEHHERTICRGCGRSGNILPETLGRKGQYATLCRPCYEVRRARNSAAAKAAWARGGNGGVELSTDLGAEPALLLRDLSEAVAHFEAARGELENARAALDSWLDQLQTEGEGALP